jgi:hypothetical protein
MTKLLRRTANSLRSVMVTDRETELFLAKTHAEVSLNSRLWGI